jgi:hypothetical protein
MRQLQFSNLYHLVGLGLPDLEKIIMEKALAQLAELSVSNVVRGYGNTFSLEFGELRLASSGEITLSVLGPWQLKEGDRVLASSQHSNWQSIGWALGELIGKTCQRKLSGKTAGFVFKPGAYVLDVWPESLKTKAEIIWSLSRKDGFESVAEYGNGYVVDEWSR